MANTEFKVGDVVKLKSGGPDMTIVSLENFNTGPGAVCIWFPTAEGKPFEWNFTFLSLKLAQAPVEDGEEE